MKKMKMRFITMFTALLVLVLIAGCASNPGPATPDYSGAAAKTTNETVTPEPTPVSTEPAPAPAEPAPAASDFNTKREITVVSREDGSGTRGAFIELFGVEVKDADGKKVDQTTLEADIVNKTDVMLTSIVNNPYAIGYVSIGSLSDTVKALSIEGTAATSANVKNGSYAISRPFNIATKGILSEVTEDFISYIMSAEGQKITSGSYVAIDDNAPTYSGGKPSGKIVIAGSSSVNPLMEKLVEGYAVINPNATIEIQMSDSTAGMTAAIDGTCDIGMASRALSEKELGELIPTVIALDGIAVIVNIENSLSDASKEDIRQIFTGEVTQWNEVIK